MSNELRTEIHRLTTLLAERDQTIEHLNRIISEMDVEQIDFADSITRELE